MMKFYSNFFLTENIKQSLIYLIELQAQIDFID